MMYLGNQAVGIATSLPQFADIAKVEIGTYKSNSDTIASMARIQHSLGEVPDFIFTYCDTFPSSSSYEDIYLMNCYCCKTYPSVMSSPGITTILKTRTGSKNVATAIFTKMPSDYSSSSDFCFPYQNDTEKLLANIEYHYVIGKFKEVTSNAS